MPSIQPIMAPIIKYIAMVPINAIIGAKELIRGLILKSTVTIILFE